MIGRAVTVLLLTAAPLLAARWVRVASPHFEVYTDTGERSARQFAERFEQARHLIGGDRSSPELPTRVLLFSSEREFARLRPAPSSQGFFQSGPDFDTIAVLDGQEAARIVLHEYTHALLNRISAPLPQWFEEGLAEVYSTAIIKSRTAILGTPIPSHLSLLAQGSWMKGSELARVGKNSSQYNESGRVGIFYAESWALVHMLTFDKKYRDGVPRFLDSLTRGEEQDQAFHAAFGKDIDAVVADLSQYVTRLPAQVQVDLPAAEDIVFSAPAPVDPADVLQLKADVLALMGREDESDELYREAARRFPNSPKAETGLAVVAMRAHDADVARNHFARAIELGARDGSTFFEYAMLLRDSGAPPARVTEMLGRAVAANPAHAEAHFILGIRASDAGEYSDAVSHLEQATRILPRQAYFWQALAYAYLKLGRSAEARLSAMRALRAAATSHEIEMARNTQQLIDDADRRQPPRAHAAVIVPDSWKEPKGDGTIAGELVEVECGAMPVRIHIRDGTRTVVLQIIDPRAVLIRGGPVQESLPCGRLTGIQVTADFISTTNAVTALRFQ